MAAKVNETYLYKLTATGVYENVLSGKPKIFPRGFWQRPDAGKNAILTYICS